ncbi:hypothetical protein AVEN_114834-1 [Araneus ventricosus]|uniref:Uncharacterized protein n=1 Tax=Araneus ventricosus TaxID=182803 RepID=A0A4Y2U6B2_ARAVE|nr:hypothetical protein AVEN_114834-1 [Araneus ventricosus]
MSNQHSKGEDEDQNRKVILNTCECSTIRDQKQGCPQNSCSGSSVWKLVANENWPINTNIQAFGNDFVLVSHAQLEFNLSNKLTNQLLNSPPGQVKGNYK